MPVITVEGARVDDLDRKRKYIREITQATAEFYGLQVEDVIMIIKENSYENIGVSGEMLKDRL